MKALISIMLLFTLTNCAWLKSNENLFEKVAEDVVEDIIEIEEGV